MSKITWVCKQVDYAARCISRRQYSVEMKLTQDFFSLMNKKNVISIFSFSFRTNVLVTYLLGEPQNEAISGLWKTYRKFLLQFKSRLTHLYNNLYLLETLFELSTVLLKIISCYQNVLCCTLVIRNIEKWIIELNLYPLLGASRIVYNFITFF